VRGRRRGEMGMTPDHPLKGGGGVKLIKLILKFI